MVAITAAILPLSCSSLLGQTVGTKAIQFNAAWWHHADSEEQQGYIIGYDDCRQLAHRPIVYVDDVQAFVDRAVNSKASGTHGSVVAAIQLSWKTMKSQEVPKGGELWAGPHGYLDGGWWGGFKDRWPPHVADEDRGYLEDYLSCKPGNVTVSDVGYYQVRLNHHYRSGGHELDKIADVLQTLMRQRMSADSK